MIRIYRAMGELPTAEQLASLLDAPTLAAWEEKHGKVREHPHLRESLAALCLLRAVLPTGNLSYEVGGKPYFSDVGIPFSLSHTCGRVFCAIQHPDAEEPCLSIGLDAETVGRISREQRARLARRWFSPLEAASLTAAEADGKDSESLFLRLWTQKEAMVKQNGCGIGGIRDADTQTACERGLLLASYTQKDVLLSVCAPKGCRMDPNVYEIPLF